MLIRIAPIPLIFVPEDPALSVVKLILESFLGDLQNLDTRRFLRRAKEQANTQAKPITVVQWKGRCGAAE